MSKITNLIEATIIPGSNSQIASVREDEFFEKLSEIIREGGIDFESAEALLNVTGVSEGHKDEFDSIVLTATATLFGVTQMSGLEETPVEEIIQRTPDSKKIKVLAEWINTCEKPLSALKDHVSPEELREILQEVTYLNIDGEFDETYALSPEELIGNCPKANKIFIKNSIIKALPALNSVNQVHIRYCPALTDLGDLPAAKEVKVSFCHALEAVGNLPAAEKVGIGYCSVLTDLGDLPAAKEVKIGHCSALEAVGNLPAAKEVEIVFCDALTDLGDLPAAEKVEIGFCHALTGLGDLPAAKEVKVSFCHALEAVGNLPAAEKVGIGECRALKAVGYLAKRREISFAVENCLLLETIDPELVTQLDREKRVWVGGSDLVWEGVLPGLGPKAAR